MTEKAWPEKAWHGGRPEALSGTISRLESVTVIPRFIDQTLLRIYHSSNPLQASEMAVTGVVNPSVYARALEQRTVFNPLRAVIDTAASIIAKNPPAVRVITAGGDYKLQRSARKISTLIAGIFQRNRLPELAQQRFIDAALTRVGATKWFVEGAEIRAERVVPGSLRWNPAEGRDPANLYQTSPASKARLCDENPALADKIRKLPTSRSPWRYMVDDIQIGVDTDTVDVNEGWHKASPSGEGGRYVRTIGDMVLAERKWPFSFHPFASYAWSPAFDSYGGRPLGEQLLPYQRLINRMANVVAESQAKACIPRVFAPKGSEFEGFSNMIGERVFYTGPTPPTIVPGQALPPEFYKWFDRVLERMYEEAGINEAAAAGTKAPGVVSGKAIREWQDVGSTRQIVPAQRFERSIEDDGRIVMGLICDTYKDSKKVLQAPGSKLIEEIDAAKLNLREDAYELRTFAVSSLPQHPSGRLEYVAELIDKGMIKAFWGPKLLAMPDLEAFEDTQLAIAELVQKQVECALEDGEFIAPEPYMGEEGLTALVDYGQRKYLGALVSKIDYPKAHLEILRRLIEQANQLLGQVAPPPAPAMAAPGMPAPAGAPPALPPAPMPAPGPVAPMAA